jgi:SulP family sulfate permease
MLFPGLRSLDGYGSEALRGDLVAGITTAVLLVPQGMAYAMLAGLPPIHGLYASLLPLLAYALFGTSRQLAVGPVAIDSLLVAAGVGAIAAAGTALYVATAALLALAVGTLQVVMGAARLGVIVNFLSRPVLTGFMAGAALIIGFTQLTHVTGVPLSSTTRVHSMLAEFLGSLGAIHPPTLALGLGSFLFLVVAKRLRPTFPRGLAVVALGAGLVFAFGAEDRGVAVIGQVPHGLPSLSLPSLDFERLGQLFPIASTIAFVAFIEAIAVAKKTAVKDEVDANRELVALGMANVAGSFAQGFPVTGGLSRTAVNAQAGARSNLAGVVTALTVGLVLLWLTPLLHYVPRAVLAAIILAAVSGLVEVQEMRRLYRVKRTDFTMMLVTLVATLGLGIERGVVIGVLTSLAALVIRTTRPHVALLGRLPCGAYRNVDRFPDARLEPGVLAVRLDAQFYFGNVNFLKEKLRELEARVDGQLRAVVLDASGINQIDASAEVGLCEIARDYRQREVRFVLANVKGPVRDVLDRSGFLERLGSEHLFLRVEDAVEAVRTGGAERGANAWESGAAPGPGSPRGDASTPTHA